MGSFTVRRVRADEWRSLRELRLRCGYVDTGVRVEMVDGVNHEMVRDL